MDAYGVPLQEMGAAMAMSDVEVAEDLARAGLAFLGWDDAPVRLPCVLAEMGATCRDEDGRVDAYPAEVVDGHDPDSAAKLNAGWYRLAAEVGLFTDDHEFLVTVSDYEPDWPAHDWARVRLLPRWDIAGSGSRVLGSSDGCAVFTALSLDNRVVVVMDWWGDGTFSSLAVIHPDQAVPLRRRAEIILTDSHWAKDQPATRRWLDAFPLRRP